MSYVDTSRQSHNRARQLTDNVIWILRDTLVAWLHDDMVNLRHARAAIEAAIHDTLLEVEHDIRSEIRPDGE
jgi:hypothetical protein